MNILTLKFGTKYGPEYVNRLYSGIKRNTSVDFNFYCYTDNKDQLNPEIKIIDLDPSIDTHWQKLEFHKRGFMPEGSKCLILDIDWVVTGNLDSLLSYHLKHRHFATVSRWWSQTQNACALHGGIQMFYNGDTDSLWKIYQKDPEYWREYFYRNKVVTIQGMGEQNFIKRHMLLPIQWMPEKWFGRFASDAGIQQMIQENWNHRINSHDPYFIDNKLNEQIKMVHFTSDFVLETNDNPISKCEWIQPYWNDV